jgi:predicted ATPase
MMWSKGYAAPETAAAFARAQELAAGSESANERFVTYLGQWGVKAVSADLKAAREIAEIMLREAGPDAQTPEALAAHRLVAVVSLSQGNFVAARTHSEKALTIDDSGWDRDAKLRFGHDSRISAFCYLGLSRWTLGELGSARQPIEKAIASAVESAHVPTLANTYYFASMLDLFRGDAEAVLPLAERTVEISREHALPLYAAIGEACHGWARTRLGDREGGLAELRQAVTDLAAQGNKLWLPLYQGLLAQVESDAQDAEGAAATIGEALVLVDQIGGYWATAFLHRIHGDILLKRDRRGATAEGEKLQATISPVAGETLSIGRPRRRCSRGACASARRLFADPGIPGDRGGAGAARRTRSLNAQTKRRLLFLALNRRACRSLFFGRYRG